MNYEYYKMHAFVAGGLLTIVLALERLNIIDLTLATIFAAPIIVYLLISIFLTYRAFKEKETPARQTTGEDVELARIKTEAKIEKKKAKALAKVEKK